MLDMSSGSDPNMIERKYGQWTIRLHADTYQMFNHQGNEHLFYDVVMGPYGAPQLSEEVSRRFAPPQNLQYADAEGKLLVWDPNWCIMGFVCRLANGELQHRFSLSNPAQNTYKVLEDGTFEINGKVWYLKRLVHKDKHRFFGPNYVAQLSDFQEKPFVTVCELVDLMT